MFEMAPTPKPAMTLPAYTMPKVGPLAAVCRIPPNMKKKPAIASNHLRPTKRLNKGGIMAPKKAPPFNTATTLDVALAHSVRDVPRLNSCLKLPSATTPPTMPVSKPNSMAPTLMAHETPRTTLCFFSVVSTVILGDCLFH